MASTTSHRKPISERGPNILACRNGVQKIFGFDNDIHPDTPFALDQGRMVHNQDALAC